MINNMQNIPTYHHRRGHNVSYMRERGKIGSSARDRGYDPPGFPPLIPWCDGKKIGLQCGTTNLRMLQTKANALNVAEDQSTDYTVDSSTDATQIPQQPQEHYA